VQLMTICGVVKWEYAVVKWELCSCSWNSGKPQKRTLKSVTFREWTM